MTLDRQDRRTRALEATACFAILLASFLYAPYVARGPTICLMKLLSGIPCPSCGMTRSFCAMAQGRVAASFHYHLFGPPAMVAAAILGLAWAYEAATGRTVMGLQRLAASRPLAWTLITGILAYYTVRMAQWGSSGQLAAWIAASPSGTCLAWAWNALSR